MQRSPAFLLALFPASALAAETLLYGVANEARSDWHTVRAVGDVDGDGRGDLAVSGHLDVRVLSGANGTLLHLFSDGAAGASAPLLAAGPGDLNGDGRADIAVGAPGDATSGAPVGALRVYSGLDGSVLFTLFGVTTAGPFGPEYAVLGHNAAGPGDGDGDGIPDVLVARAGTSLPPAARDAALVVSGADGAILAAIEPTNAGLDAGNYVGLSGAGDVDLDGRADVLVSFVSSPYFGSCSSNVLLASGDGAVLRDLSDPDLCALGVELAAAGDLDGDGAGDVILGTPFGNWKGEHFGGVAVGISGATGQRLFLREGIDPYGGFGGTIAVAGDVDGDGGVDVAVGEISATGPAGSDSGRVHVFAGGGGAPLACALIGTAPAERFGASVAAPGDLDGDGLADLAILEYGPQAMPEVIGAVSTWSLAGCAPADDVFVPGSELAGTIASSGDVDTARFSAPPGSRLILRLSLPQPGLQPSVEVARASGDVIATWQPQLGPGQTKVKKLTLLHGGDYELRVRSADGSTGAWSLETRRKIKGLSKSFSKTKHGAGASKPPQVQFTAVAGSHVTAWVEPKSGLSPHPPIALLLPSGAALDLAAFVTPSFASAGTWLGELLLPESGTYVLSTAPAGGAGTKATFVVDLWRQTADELLTVD